MIKRSFTLLLAVWLVALAASPVNAADAENTNEIQLECQFSDADTVDLTDYLATKIIVLHNEQYLMGQYDENDNSYYVTGYTDYEEVATEFQFGRNPAVPDQLVITGLRNGEYKLRTIDTKTGYMTGYALTVSFSPDSAFMGSQEVELQREEIDGRNRLVFHISYYKGFDIPIGEPYDTTSILISAIAGTIAIISLIALIAILIHWQIQKKREFKNG